MTNNTETEPRTGMAQLVSGIIADAQGLMKQQLALFRLEVHDDVRRFKKGSMLVALGGAVVFLGAFLSCLSVVYLLSWAMPQWPLWAWYAVVAIPVLAVGGALVMAGSNRLKTLDHPLEQSTRALKENFREPIEALKENGNG